MVSIKLEKMLVYACKKMENNILFKSSCSIEAKLKRKISVKMLKVIKLKNKGELSYEKRCEFFLYITSIGFSYF